MGPRKGSGCWQAKRSGPHVLGIVPAVSGWVVDGKSWTWSARFRRDGEIRQQGGHGDRPGPGSAATSYVSARVRRGQASGAGPGRGRTPGSPPGWTRSADFTSNVSHELVKTQGRRADPARRRRSPRASDDPEAGPSGSRTGCGFGASRLKRLVKGDHRAVPRLQGCTTRLEQPRPGRQSTGNHRDRGGTAGGSTPRDRDIKIV